MLAQGPAVVEVGRVSAVYWDGDHAAALRLAELADGAARWPGIAQPSGRRIRLLIVRDERRFDSLTGGRLPEWSVGAAYPSSGTIVLHAARGDVVQALRHELAHLALHDAVAHVPRWFDEGYAAYAAGEWNRLEALRVNWALVRRRPPALAELDRALRTGGAAQADAAYAFATTAVLLLARLGGERGLEPLITRLGTTADFDRALRETYQLTLGQFEARWQRDLRSRYGWILFATSFSVFWALVGSLMIVLAAWRRRRDRERRAALDRAVAAAQGAGDAALDAPGTPR